jgi:hypothetical protein
MAQQVSPQSTQDFLKIVLICGAILEKNASPRRP